MTKQAIKQSSDMEHVWKDISDTWGRLNVNNDNPAAPFALTREIDNAGGFTDDMVDRIYARYEFCEGFTNAQLAELKTLALALKGNAGMLPEELVKLEQSLENQIARAGQKSSPSENHSYTPLPEDVTWRPFSPMSKTTWPDKHQNIVFGPQFSYPISARFDNGTWYRHGSNTPLQGVTKFMHVPAPKEWS